MLFTSFTKNYLKLLAAILFISPFTIGSIYAEETIEVINPVEEELEEIVEIIPEKDDITIFQAAEEEVSRAAKPQRVIMPTPEIDKNKKLLLKAIRDLDAFRVSIKYVGDHNDSDSRLLLLYETDKYIEKFVDPLLGNYMMRAKDIFHLAAYLEFLKAYLFLESGQPYRYKEALRSMKKKYGNRHLNVPVAPFKAQFRTIGEAISILGKKIP